MNRAQGFDLIVFGARERVNLMTVRLETVFKLTFQIEHLSNSHSLTWRRFAIFSVFPVVYEPTICLFHSFLLDAT